MIVSDLKKSILQYAISGKLTKQLSTDTSVNEMLQSICIQKKEYKTRLNKYNESINQDIPFQIPDTWHWIELKDIALDIYAGGDKPKKFSNTKTDVCNIPVVANGETNDGIIGYTDFATENENALTVAGRGTIGFSKYRTEPFTPIVRLIVIKLPKEINYKYLQRVFELLIETGVGTSIKQLTVPMIVNKYIPIPPIEEQQRIVEKIEEFYYKLDEISPIELEIQRIKEALPLDMKKSILTYVFMGKMTKRESTDTPIENIMEKILEKHDELLSNKIIKKESKITPIDLSEVPFAIPSEWCWSKLYYCLDVRDGTHDSPKYVKNGTPLITSKNLNKDGSLNDYDLKYVSDEDREKIDSRSKVELGDILFAMIGSIGNPVVINSTPDFCIKNVALFKNPVKEYINNKYLYYYLDYSQLKMKKESTGGVQQFVSLNYLRNFYIPIPPIEEQQRIVNTIEELLPLCNEINDLVN